ncbi:hypothetical protein BD749_1386 [Pontibacter ramchanderi]|uniref:Uncharacterized protein n=1 Tax=Pontibacter ramchanderi TaxID=1179743 RepID=A0A2N3V490_9BACT|nr:hypothetical protein BD749_1386 [Pontibacter ramchanderi]
MTICRNIYFGFFYEAERLKFQREYDGIALNYIY